MGVTIMSLGAFAGCVKMSGTVSQSSRSRGSRRGSLGTDFVQDLQPYQPFQYRRQSVRQNPLVYLRWRRCVVGQKHLGDGKDAFNSIYDMTPLSAVARFGGRNICWVEIAKYISIERGAEEMGRNVLMSRAEGRVEGQRNGLNEVSRAVVHGGEWHGVDNGGGRKEVQCLPLYMLFICVLCPFTHRAFDGAS